MTRALLTALAFLHAGWGGYYIYRTSFVVEGVRVYSLWDDGMVSMQYARNLASGKGLTWNGDDERVQGISNPGATLMMAGLHLYPFDETKAALRFQLINLAALVAILLFGFDVGRRFTGSEWAGLAVALSLFLYAPLSIWALQGSDAGLVCVVLWWAVWVLARAWPSRQWPNAVWGILVLGIVIRPDFSIFYPVFLLFPLAWKGDVKRNILIGFGALCLVWTALITFGIAYYGDPLPNTFYLKMTGSPRWLVLRSALGQLRPLALWSVFPVLLFSACWLVFLRKEVWSYFLIGLLVAVAGYHLWSGGDWLPTHVSRFLVPGVPFLFLVGIWSGCRGTRKPVVLLLLALVASCAMNTRTAMAEWWAFTPHTLLRDRNEENVRIAFLLKTFTASDTTVALHWAGATSYFAARRMVDVLGKSDAHIARLQVGVFYPGHSKWDWDYILNVRRPDVIPHETRGLGRHPVFQRDYQTVSVPGERKWFVRRDSMHKVGSQ